MMQRMTKVFALSYVLCLCASLASADGLRVGRAAVDITPPVGTPMLTPQRPPFEVKLAAQALDPLQVKAIVLEQGGVRAALVACDLTSLPLRLLQEARKLIGETTGVDPNAVIISSTHTHTAPQIRLKYLSKADEEAKRKAAEYVAALPAKIAESVKAAEADLQAATAYAGYGSEDSVSFNRRYYLRDGTVAANPFKGEDHRLGEILRPAGPIDPSVGLVAFKNRDGQPLAVMVNFSIHLDTLGVDQPSADMAAVVSRMLQAVHGEQMLVFWGSGASGNVNHYDLSDPQRFRREKGVYETTRIGTILAAAALRAYPKLEPIRDSPLRVSQETVLCDYHPEKVTALRARMKNSSRYFDGEVDVVPDGDRLAFEADVEAIALGNELAWVGLPGEMFVELGMNLKNASPFRYTMIHSLANGAIGYVPNLKSYPEGSREVLATRCAPGTGERLIESATKQLAQLKGVMVPQTVQTP